MDATCSGANHPPSEQINEGNCDKNEKAPNAKTFRA
jgi:hypothetical protein